MNIKLLKKIRKRYSIIQIDELSSNVNDPDFYHDIRYVDINSMPIFKFIDKIDGFYQYCNTYQEAYDVLLNEIKTHYNEKFRHKDEVSKKIWWKK